MWQSIVGYITVGVLWGCTNPFIKHAQAISARNKTDKEKKNEHLFSSLLNMFQDVSVLIPFAVNQMGSLVFYMLLYNEPISIASPVCNSLTFIFTAITGHFILGEDIPSPTLMILGSLCVVIGIYICITS